MSEFTPPLPSETPVLMPPPEVVDNSALINDMQEKSSKAGRLSLRYNNRMERAGTTMERMDHKDALYSDLGFLALGESVTQQDYPAITAAGERAKPRSVFERRVDRRINKRKVNMLHKQAEVQQKTEIYGEHVRGSENHATKLEKIQQKRQAKKLYKNGDITKSEYDLEKAKINAKRIPVQKTKRRLKNMRANFREDRLRRSVEQPVLSRWREGKRNRSIGRIKKNYYKADSHRQEAERLRRQIVDLESTD